MVFGNKDVKDGNLFHLIVFLLTQKEILIGLMFLVIGIILLNKLIMG